MGRDIEVAVAIILSLSVICTSSGDVGREVSNNIRCHNEERDALLKFKDELIIGYANPLDTLWDVKSWPDCCNWIGVTCHNLTGYALVLNISHVSLQYKAKLSPALQGLKHLQFLDVGRNSFDETQIPSFLGSMRELRYLRLRVVSMRGEITNQLRNLSKLEYLDVSNPFFYSGRSSSLEWLEGMPNLKYLNLNYINLSMIGDSWGRVLSNLSSLTELHLSGCRLSGHLPLHDISNLVGLRVLNLRSNLLVGELPYSIGNLTSLTQLDLSYNNINGVIPDSIGYLSSLNELDLSDNNISGVIPYSIGKLASLLKLDLSENRVSGKVPKTLCNLHSLQKLYFFHNLLEQFPQCPKGGVPVWFEDLPSLSDLDLAENQLKGPFPLTLFMSTNLIAIDFNMNQLGGVINENHLERFSKLTRLEISSNYFVIDIVNHNWVPPFQLSYLNLGSCSIVGHQFPLWLRTQTRLETLDLSNTTLKGPIPTWFWQWVSASSSILNRLYLSHNQIEGHLPKSMPINLTNIDLSYNKLSGKIPPTFQTEMMVLSANNLTGPVPNLGSLVTYFMARKNRLNGTLDTTFIKASELMVLDISENQITGVIPANLGNCTSLEVLMLSDNYLYGGIPESIGQPMLTSLHLKKNFLSGSLPLSLGNWSELEVLDISKNYISGNILPIMAQTGLKVISLGNNLFTGEIPFSVSNMSGLQVFEVSQNGFWGRIPTFGGMISQTYRAKVFGMIDSKLYFEEEVSLFIKGQENKYGSILFLVTSIDLSENKFQGEIPQELMKLPGLMFLNMSHNRLTGKIPQDIGQLKSLESLDLSNNRLTGEIPVGLSRLSSLAVLNLSDNRLEGRIPAGPQLDTFNGSFFANNLNLCGPQLGKQCPQDSGKQVRLVDNMSDSATTSTWFYVGIMCGFVVGFWVILGTLILGRDLRISFFNFFDNISEKVRWDCVEMFGVDEALNKQAI